MIQTHLWRTLTIAKNDKEWMLRKILLHLRLEIEMAELKAPLHYGDKSVASILFLAE